MKNKLQKDKKVFKELHITFKNRKLGFLITDILYLVDKFIEEDGYRISSYSKNEGLQICIVWMHNEEKETKNIKIDTIICQER